MNRVFNWMKLFMLVGVFSAAITVKGAESYPFPQNVDYSYGLKPDGVKDSDVQAAYDYWKTNFVTSSGACGERRVIFDYFPGTQRGKEDRSATVSEGIAYGMLIAAYMGDQSLFDDLWAYYKKHRNQNGVMNWQIRNCGTYGQNGASDAELDVAMALIVASHQWQSDVYKTDAESLVRVIREKEFDGDILKPGDMFGGQSLVCPSYFSPAYYRVFATLDSEKNYVNFWNNAADKGYEIINKSIGTSGLVPDWCTANGTVSSEAGQYEDDGKNFIFDGIRTPFRSGVDFLWHGNADAKAYCEKLSTWLTNNHGHPSQIGSKYGTKLSGNDGAKLNNDHNNTFVGCFGVGLMGTEFDGKQSYLNQIYTENVSVDPNYGEYFNASFKILSLLVMTGNFYLPPPDQCDGPVLGDNRSLCEGSPLSLDANVTNRNYVWKRNGTLMIGESSQTLSVTTSGTYEVVATDATGCVRRDKVEVYDAALDADFTAVPGPGVIILTNTSKGGVSDYAWSVIDPDGGEETSTEESFNPTALKEGKYDITLTIENSGFGCAENSTVTKSVIIGAGNGLALDDFNGLWDQGIALYSYGDKGNPFAETPKTWCSADDFLDNKAKLCDNFMCSNLEVVVTGGASAVDWGSYVIDFNNGDNSNRYGPIDLSTSPFVSVSLKADKPVTVSMGVRDIDEVDGLESFDLTTDYQTFTIDLSSAGVDLENVIQFLIRPFTDDVDFTGTILVDYVVLGSATLPKPQFDTRVDEYGFTDYSNYLPEYYPNDPAYADCDVENTPGNCYGAVPDWEREVYACDGLATITANACTANEIIWKSGNTIVGTGNEVQVGPGFYYVDLVNNGGVTRDSITVVGSGVVEAGFTYVKEDNGYGLRLYNTSEGFDSFTWDYDYTSSNEDLEGNETWEEGYMYYDDEGTYEVCISIEESTCGGNDTYCEEIEIKCVQEAYSFDITSSSHTITNDSIYACGGVPITVTADAGSDLADITNFVGWYGFADNDAMSSTEEVTFSATDFSNYLKITTTNKCGEDVADSVWIEVTPEVVANVAVDEALSLENQTTFDAPLYTVFTTPWAGDNGTYEWYVDGNLVADATGLEAHVDFFNYGGPGMHNIKVIVNGDCGTDVESDIDVCINAGTGDVAFTTGENYMDLGLFITNFDENYFTYTWIIDDVEIEATSGDYTHTFATTGDHTVQLKVDNGCDVELSTVLTYDAQLSCTTIDASDIGAVSGLDNVCSGADEMYSVNDVDGVTYAWAVSGAGSSIVSGQGTNEVNVVLGSVDAVVSVVATGCEDVDADLDVMIKSEDIGMITGLENVCKNSVATYSVGDADVTYVWSVTGATIASGQGTNEIDVTFGSTDAEVSVRATGCAVVDEALDVMIKSEDIGTISGSGNSCVNGQGTYSVGDVDGITYLWSVSGAGTLINSGQGSNEINVTFGSANAVVSLKATGCEVVDLDKSVEISTTVNPTFTASGSGLSRTLTSEVSGSVYAWTINGDNKSGESVDYSFPALGSYSVSLDVTNDCGQGDNTEDLCIDVDESMFADMTGSTNLEQGMSATYAVTAVAGAEYDWSYPGDWAATQNGASLDVSSIGVSGMVSVTITAPCGTGTVSRSYDVITSAPIEGVSVIVNGNGDDGVTGEVVYTGGTGLGNDVITWTVNGSPISGVSADGSFSHVIEDGTHEFCVTISNDISGTGTPVCENIKVTNNCDPQLTNIGDVEVESTESEICEGEDVTFSIANVTNAVSYTWTIDGQTFDGQSATVTGGTTKINALVEVSSGGATACIATKQGAVSVTAIPTATLKASSNEICEGQSVSLIATGGDSYEWTGLSATEAEILESPSTNATYSVVAITNECRSAVSTPVSVTVNSAPSAPSISALTDKVCGEGTTTISVNNASSHSYNWSNGSTGSSITALGGKTYSVTATSGGCESGSSNSITIVSETAKVANAMFELGSIDNFKVTATAEMNNDTYSWSLNSASASGSTYEEEFTLTEGTHTLTLDVIANNDVCEDTEDSFSKTFDVDANGGGCSQFVSTPVITTASGKDSFCDDEEVVFSVEEDDNATFTWEMSEDADWSTNSSGTGNVFAVYLGVNSGLVTVTATSKDSQCPVETATKEITVKPYADASFSEYTSNSVDYEFTADEPSNSLTYVWTIDNGQIAKSDSAILIHSFPEEKATYTVKLTVSGGCDAPGLGGTGETDENSRKFALTGINGVEDFDTYTSSVYPTNAHNEVNVFLGSSFKGTFDVVVTNMTGAQIETTTMRGGETLQLNVSDYTSGMYIVRVSNGSQIFTEKFEKN